MLALIVVTFPSLATGIENEGVFCEFCHKIDDAALDSETGLPYSNMPNVLSPRLYRLEERQPLFFGQHNYYANFRTVCH